MNISLNSAFAVHSRLNGFDVLQIKKSLNRLGYYTPYDKTGITDMADVQIFASLKQFQSDQNLPVTGEARPDDNTIRALNHALKNAKNGHYIWHIVEDGHARPSHAKLNRTIREWDDTPNPGDDYNCRCWATPVSNEDVKKLSADAIYPTIGPVEILAGGVILNSTKIGIGLMARTLSAILRDVEWIRHVSSKQLQKKFKHAEILGIKGNQNKQNLATFKKALEDHIKSPDTKVIKGTYHKEPVTHYYNPKTGVNIMRGNNGEYISNWKLEPAQIEHLLKNGSLGGNKL